MTKKLLIPSITGRIGEFAEQADLMQKAKILGWREPFTPVWITSLRTNTYLRDLVAQCTDAEIILTAEQFEEAGKLHQEGQLHDPSVYHDPKGVRFDEDRAAVALNSLWHQADHDPIFSYPPGSLLSKSEGILGALGIRSDWFVTVHCRTEHYLGRELDKDGKQKYYDNHNRYRNADVTTFNSAIDHIIEEGGYVVHIREGDMPSLAPRTGLVDFVRDSRKDWADIFLFTQCKFLLCTTSGPWCVASVFNTPVAQTNTWPLSERTFTSNSLFIPKLYRSKSSGRTLSLIEGTQEPLRHCFNGDAFDKRHQGTIEVIDNSPNDILGLVKDMFRSLGITGPFTDIQKAYNNIASTWEPYGVLGPPATSFLSSHPELLP